MPVNPFTNPHDYSPADALHDHLQNASAGQSGPAGTMGAGGSSGSVLSFLAVGAAGLGAIVGLIVGRDDRLVTTVVFALLFGVPVWLLGMTLRLLGLVLRRGGSGLGRLGGVPGWIVRGGCVGALAGAGVAWFVGGVPLMEGVVKLAPVGAVVGGVLRIAVLAVRRR